MRIILFDFGFVFINFVWVIAFVIFLMVVGVVLKDEFGGEKNIDSILIFWNMWDYMIIIEFNLN